MTSIIEGARIELMRGLAWYDRYCKERNAAEPEKAACFPTHAPLFVEEWKHTDSEMLCAAKEAAALGHIEFNDQGRHPNGPMVRITPEGMAWIDQYAVVGSITPDGAA